MDNNEVYALFEGIKKDLNGINSKLENAPKVANDQSGGQPPAVDLSLIKELFDSSAKEHQKQTKAMLTKFAEEEVCASNRILHLLRNLKESFITNSSGRTSRRSISTVINSTSNPAGCFLFWSAWVSYAAFPSGATSSFGKPSVSMQTMR